MEDKSTEKTVKAVKKGITFKPVVFKSLEAYSEELLQESARDSGTDKEQCFLCGSPKHSVKKQTH
jgi:hypothetical protein